MAHDGSPIFAFQDAQDTSIYISNVALMMGHTSSGEKVVAAVSLNDRSTWTGFMPPPADAPET